MERTVIVAMSGGVDSSVVAYLFKKFTSYKVIGLFMKNWEEKTEDGLCSSIQDYEDVERVCLQLDIPYYTVSFAKEYRERVFTRFLREYSLGYTPNPDILCNREIKFDLLQKKVRELGGDYLATGHYCRLNIGSQGPQLMRGLDIHKDQSYFLSGTPKGFFHNVLFPLGKMNKTQVRAIAAEAALATAEKKDSTGICFIGKRPFKDFLEKFIPNKVGNIIDWDTKEVIGKHEGAHYYTVGQRRGLDLGGSEKPCYVIGKNIEENVVYIVRGEDHPQLYLQELTARELNWFVAPDSRYCCTAKVRYRSPDEECVLEHISDDEVRVRFSQPVKAVTPGQTIAFYHGEFCLGSGVIDVSMIPSKG
ncbi:tRNA-specific 2-thiouridylase mnmA,tRNA-specific 2-thiouridylase MnmA,Predicted ATPase of the PP-loop superfamily implicated in cell cycle control,tRNA (5-methylaminomethyl-2-thiouridylate)-methyltransferase,tRNA methyl transferase [Chlamydia serpentis]|uniref:tRNA-specific 2-thiouridylase MnmA n=1 Tax=Chlamydia serpentis TaxID=1967782 RepID=A0A2R8FAX0_9CHLA|nr:tRNA 2-thiouridine(34) synthase MnmA [Chlamydia serpentis]SPN73573.1 tRNA-specific 2-thiouridylase mnmA,tRNA-specific 2-thiouridylase MnmA,Predicted ATPase of the PP-loop superfamily implicated in cell cycle control,tRNA (5-methylaminomethyl-2-thiouridylate)-methyltransferase,tRNA methyl transferase [Chlamydia serpentis]